jgi:hypothetical protein
MSAAADIRRKEEQARRLAASIADPEMRATLLDIADHLKAEAATAERSRIKLVH